MTRDRQLFNQNQCSHVLICFNAVLSNSCNWSGWTRIADLSFPIQSNGGSTAARTYNNTTYSCFFCIEVRIVQVLASNEAEIEAHICYILEGPIYYAIC